MATLLGLSSLGATEPPKPGSPAPSPQEAEVTGVVLDPATRQPVVLLQGKRDRRPLAMAIGPFEANGIAIALQGVTPPRPLTHDLFLNVLGDLRASLKRIVVTDLRARVPILVEDRVFDKADRIVPKGGSTPTF
jgi:bifunctional DNase/RNase